MTRTQWLMLSLGSGLLLVSLLAWGGKSVSETMQFGFSLLFSGGLLGGYAWWLYAKWAVRSWLAPSILLGCLLLTAGVDMGVYQRAQASSYVRDEGWISDLVYYTPDYDGEAQVLVLLFGGPLLGAGLLGRYARKGQRGWQFLHYLILLLTGYPLAALLLYSSIGTKPRYYEGTQLPATVADSLRVVRRDLPSRIYPTKPQ